MRSSFIDFNTMSERDRKLLFGESIKSTEELSLSKTKSIFLKDNDDPSPETLVSEPQFQRKLTSGELWIQKYVISYNNPFKSAWDVFVMLLVIYSSITTAYT